MTLGCCIIVSGRGAEDLPSLLRRAVLFDVLSSIRSLPSLFLPGHTHAREKAGRARCACTRKVSPSAQRVVVYPICTSGALCIVNQGAIALFVFGAAGLHHSLRVMVVRATALALWRPLPQSCSRRKQGGQMIVDAKWMHCNCKFCTAAAL